METNTWEEKIVTLKATLGGGQGQFEYKNKRSITSSKDYHFTHVL